MPSKMRGLASVRDALPKLREKQDNSCGICGRAFGGLVVECVDHDHVDGHVRGLLCRECNIALGCIEKVRGDWPLGDLLESFAYWLSSTAPNCSKCGEMVSTSGHASFMDGPKRYWFCRNTRSA